LLLERLPPTEEFMKKFVVEVLGYLLPSFDDELLGIQIMDFSFSLFFLLLFFIKDLLPLTLGYNELGEEINHNFGAFIWKPNNLFGSFPSVGERFLGGKGMFLRTPRVGVDVN
jgi:hypothetical protein